MTEAKIFATPDEADEYLHTLRQSDGPAVSFFGR